MNTDTDIDKYPKHWVPKTQAILGMLEGIPRTLASLDIHKYQDETRVFLWECRDYPIISYLTKLDPIVFRRDNPAKILKRYRAMYPDRIQEKNISDIIYKTQVHVSSRQRTGIVSADPKDTIMNQWIEPWARAHELYRQKVEKSFDKAQEKKGR